jgi:hypothetical protein
MREVGVGRLAEASFEELPHAVSHVAPDPGVGKNGPGIRFQQLVHRPRDVLPRVHQGAVEIENDELHASMPVGPARAV